MNLLTVARRADFGSSLRRHFSDARGRLSAGKSYSQVVQASLTLEKAQQEFHEFTCLTGLMSVCEAIVSDLATEFLVRYPGHLRDKATSLYFLAGAGSVGATIESLVSKAVNEWAYLQFPEFVRKVIALYDEKASLDAELLGCVNEVKATRDLFIHAGGVVNSVYLRKAGPRARSSNIGEKLKLGPVYIAHAQGTIERFFDEVERLVPAEIWHMGKTNALRTMWDATVLAELVPFEKGWDVVDGDMARPNDKGLRWGWSESEKRLLDFFLGIYSEDYPTRKHDISSALLRWPPSTDEGKVMMSWLDSPFWF